MKSIKLSLVAALAAGSLTALSASPLDEAIKNVDVSGFAWYRYDTGRYHSYSDSFLKEKTVSTIGNVMQTHKFKSAVNLKIGLSDNIKVFTQLMYWANANKGYYNGRSDLTTTANANANTKQEVILRLAGIEYNAFNTKFSLGRQVLGTIWTDDMAGMAAKAVANVAPGMQIAAFAVDSFETNDGDRASGDMYLSLTNNTGLTTHVDSFFYSHNLYGAAFLGDFGAAKAQVWAAYWHKVGGFAALKVNFDTPAFGVAFNALANFLGDTAKTGNEIATVNISYGGGAGGAASSTSVANALSAYNLTKTEVLDNGLFLNLKGKVNFSPVDAFIGVAHYGKKDALTLNRLEDANADADMAIGREVSYQKNTWTVLSNGQNTLAYLGVGFKPIRDLRLGIQAVYGQNTIGKDNIAMIAYAGISNIVAGTPQYSGVKDQKTNVFEGVVEANYKVTPKLNILAYYSYLHNKIKAVNDTDTDTASARNAIRLQVRYGF